MNMSNFVVVHCDMEDGIWRCTIPSVGYTYYARHRWQIDKVFKRNYPELLDKKPIYCF